MVADIMSTRRLAPTSNHTLTEDHIALGAEKDLEERFNHDSISSRVVLLLYVQ
jgi:hypothetical protein